MKVSTKPNNTGPDAVNSEKGPRHGSGVSTLTIHFVNKTQRIRS
jgi:hypothetical protein